MSSTVKRMLVAVGAGVQVAGWALDVVVYREVICQGAVQKTEKQNDKIRKVQWMWEVLSQFLQRRSHYPQRFLPGGE